MKQRHSGGNPGNDGQAESPIRKANRHGGTACECCGNEYDKAIEIVVNGISHYYDCFECAIHMLAPKCTAAASSGTGMNQAERFSAARIAPRNRAFAKWSIAPD